MTSTLPESARMLGSRLKVQRAKEHIGDLNREIKAFFDTQPYTVTADDEAETGDQVYRLHVHRDPRIEWGLLIGDAIHNLRSSLDLLMNQLVEGNGGTVTESTCFPISASRTKFDSPGTQGKVNGISKSARRVLVALKPYQGGNEALWRLHRLDIVDKHRVLMPVGMTYGSMIVVVNMPPWEDAPDVPVKSPPMRLQLKDRMYPLVDEAEVFRVKRAAREVQNDYQFSFDVAFGKGGLVEGEPVLPTLTQLADYVEGVLNAFASVMPPDVPRPAVVPSPLTAPSVVQAKVAPSE